MEYKRIYHTLDPIWFNDSKILILGTMPSPKSRERMSYYAHPQNRFWKVMAALFEESEPLDNTEKEMFLKRHKIALWDVIESCDIVGASDASIRNPVANDIASLIAKTEIQKIYTTGSTAFRLYQKLLESKTGIPAVMLPSPSPANARWRLNDLVQAYAELIEIWNKTTTT